MSKIMELRSKRNALWEQTKDFLEQHRGENGLVAAEAVEQYNKMAADVKALGQEIERLEQQAQVDAELAKPTSEPVRTPVGGKTPEKPTATKEYKEAFWNMIRNTGDNLAVRNALSIGVDTEGGYTVPDEFHRKLIEALEENNIFRSIATVITTSSGTRKIPIAEDTGEASWIDEGEEIPESDATFGQTTLSAYKLGTMIKISNELIDHISGDRLDNRRCNLRVVTSSQNNRNQKLRADNTTGYKGIWYVKRLDRYMAELRADGVKHYLGVYKTPEEAAHAYDEGARRIHGEYACLNFPLPGERGCHEAV